MLDFKLCVSETLLVLVSVFESECTVTSVKYKSDDKGLSDEDNISIRFGMFEEEVEPDNELGIATAVAVRLSETPFVLLFSVMLEIGVTSFSVNSFFDVSSVVNNVPALNDAKMLGDVLVCSDVPISVLITFVDAGVSVEVSD